MSSKRGLWAYLWRTSLCQGRWVAPFPAWDPGQLKVRKSQAVVCIPSLVPSYMRHAQQLHVPAVSASHHDGVYTWMVSQNKTFPSPPFSQIVLSQWQENKLRHSEICTLPQETVCGFIFIQWVLTLQENTIISICVLAECIHLFLEATALCWRQQTTIVPHHFISPMSSTHNNLLSLICPLVQLKTLMGDDPYSRQFPQSSVWKAQENRAGTSYVHFLGTCRTQPFSKTVKEWYWDQGVVCPKLLHAYKTVGFQAVPYPVS